MKFILFDKSAIELLVTMINCQSTEYAEGKALTEIISGNLDNQHLIKRLSIQKVGNGLFFVGEKKSDEILVLDLTKCDLIKTEKDSPENLLIVIQKMFRAAMHFWYRQPFTNSERVNNSKLVVFPFPYNYNSSNNKRLVLEREPRSKRLIKRGISSPLLVYKYNDESMPYGSEEAVNVNVLDDAGDAYVSLRYQLNIKSHQNEGKETDRAIAPLGEVETSASVYNEGFKYLNYDLQVDKLTSKQKEVVNYPNKTVPLRIVGAAGTGKTTSMLLRAYRLLTEAEQNNESFRIIFFSHSESTRFELENAFRTLDANEKFLDKEHKCSIEFITLFAFCRRFRNIKDIQVADNDASDAKEYQLLLIEGSFKEVHSQSYKMYKQYLSEDFKSLLENTDSYILASMLQHEFSVQIKGKCDGNIEKYKEIIPLKHGLPINNSETYKDKDYVYKIYQNYQKQLELQAVYDTDDIVIEALLGLNAPIWRRERAMHGYDYLFVDEMHLFNSNEQLIFHYLTKDINQSKIPICFALDYSQAIGDRGDITESYIEKNLSQDGEVEYNTILRSSSAIIDLCASIVASGTLIFQAAFRDPYKKSPQNSFSLDDEKKSVTPKIIMCSDESKMLDNLKIECDTIIKELTCKNSQVAIITFEDKYLSLEYSELLKEKLQRNVSFLNGRNVSLVKGQNSKNDAVIFTSPYNINGLEFDAVILLGVDGKRVPPTENVSDIAKNYLKYKAYNMLYLASSRARYRVIMLGNEQNGESECLSYAIAAETLQKENRAL